MEPESHESVEEVRMSFFEHLEELRARLIRAVIAIMIGFGLCIGFKERLYNIIADPILRLLPPDSSLVFTGLPDPFFIHLKVAFVVGLFLAFPFVLYQIWLFVKPGLLEHERKLALPTIIIATLLFYSGAAFAYFIVFPAAFSFFLGYETTVLKPMIAIKEYVSLVALLMLAFGAVFETAVLIVFLGLLGVVDSAFLKKGRRYFVVLAFIIAAILTPTPDVVNQVLMAVPMMLFYELGIQVLVIFERRRRKKEERVASELEEGAEE
ncbi:MAG: twin-arginine translocase subunit TatC [Desulfomonilaceae bacterium]